MRNIFNTILEQILPSLYARKANKELKNKINGTDGQSNIAYMDYSDKISLDVFKQKYAETFDVKNKFEDKAKTNVIGITIAITVIMGASGLTLSISNKFTSDVLQWVSFTVLLLAIIYLLLSGIRAIKVLFQENVMSTIELSDISSDDKEMKEKYDACINQNINRNIIRNNIVFSSYICIRNALICMVVLFCLVAIPFSSTQTNSSNDSALNNKSSISYNSAIIIPEDISIVDINESVFQDKTARNSIENGKTYSFVNIDKKFYVQYKCFGVEIIIEHLSCFDNILNEP